MIPLATLVKLTDLPEVITVVAWIVRSLCPGTVKPAPAFFNSVNRDDVAIAFLFPAQPIEVSRLEEGDVAAAPENAVATVCESDESILIGSPYSLKAGDVLDFYSTVHEIHDNPVGKTLSRSDGRSSVTLEKTAVSTREIFLGAGSEIDLSV